MTRPGLEDLTSPRSGRRPRQTLAPAAESACDGEADQPSHDNKDDDHKKDEFTDACQETSSFEVGSEQDGLSHGGQHSLMVGPRAPPCRPEIDSLTDEEYRQTVILAIGIPGVRPGRRQKRRVQPAAR